MSFNLSPQLTILVTAPATFWAPDMGVLVSAGYLHLHLHRGSKPKVCSFSSLSNLSHPVLCQNLGPS